MALDELLDEHEQGERVRAWLRNNGAALIGGIALGLGAIFGWKWWQQEQLDARIAAASGYQEAIAPLAEGDAARAAPLVAAIDDAPYDTLAALRMAKAQADAGQGEDAIATLRAVPATDPALAGIVQLRLARLLVDTGKAEEALSLLDDADQPAALELRGDAEASLGRRDAARAAYEQAIAGLEDTSPQRQLLEIKLVAVGGTPPADDADADS
jgi:predicted negative regulator of RcsB-dependent stress response